MSNDDAALKVRVISGHTATERWNGYHELVRIGDPICRDSLGRKNASGGYSMWLPFRCNNGDCFAEVIVSADSIADLADLQCPQSPDLVAPVEDGQQ